MAVFEPSEPYENRSKPMTAARKRILSAIIDANDAESSHEERIAALEAALDAETTGILARLDAIEAALE